MSEKLQSISCPNRDACKIKLCPVCGSTNVSCYADNHFPRVRVECNDCASKRKSSYDMDYIHFVNCIKSPKNFFAPIERITITSLFGIEGNDYKIDLFSNSRFTIVYAFNGVGKSTILKLIDAVLNQKFFVLDKISHD